MLNRDNEQRFPLTALIIILVLIVLASLVLMSFRSTALPPSPSEMKGQHVFVNNMNFEPFYFYSSFSSEGETDSNSPVIPLDFGAMVVKSMDLYDMKKYKEAEDLLRTLSLFYPNSAYTAHLLANTLFAQKEYQAAEQFYITALRLSQTVNPLIYNDLAMTQAMQNKFTNAISNMKKAIQYGKSILPKAEWNLAGFYLRAGQKEESLKLFLALLRQTPPALLENIEWDPVFEPLFQNVEVQNVLKEKLKKEH